MLTTGSVAPDFSLPSHTGSPVRLSDFRGKQRVVLAFHPLAFTPVCAVQMQRYEQARPTFDALDAHVLGVSVDAGPAKAAWAESLGGISFELLSDFHPKGEVARAYGVMREDGISERAIFVIDKDGKVAWAKQYDIPQQPPIDEVIGVWENLKA
jgi:peroxiredoxin (alkyl hydroperoxide reductase subunit C)